MILEINVNEYTHTISYLFIVVSLTEIIEIKKFFLPILGEFYSKQCVIILSRSIGECYKAKALLLEAYFFSNKMYTNRYLRRQIKNTYVMAKNVLKDDQELEYMNTKIACEVK